MAVKSAFMERMAIMEMFSGTGDESIALRKNIYERYRDIAEAYGSNPLKLNVVKGNPETFSVLCYEPIALAALSQSREKREFLDIAQQSQDIKVMFKNQESFDKVIKEAMSALNCDGTEEMTRDQVNAKLMGYNPNNLEPKPLDEEVLDTEDYDLDGEQDNFTIDDIEQMMGEEDAENIEVSDTEEIEQYEEDSDELDPELAAILNQTMPEDGTSDIQFDQSELDRIKDEATREGRIEGVDETSKGNQEDTDIDTSDVGLVPDIDELVASIINRNQAVFRSCLELDRPYGMLYEKGLLSYKVSSGTMRYIPGVGRGTSVFEKLYQKIVEGTGARLSTAPDLRNVPNSLNLAQTRSNYYPGYIFKYAMGIVDDKKHTTWSKFEADLKTSVTTKLKKLYKSGVFFENITKIEQAFSNSILILSYEAGSGMKLRVSLPGQQINPTRLESKIKEVMTFNNASITITNVSGYSDVVDVQILQNEGKFLDRPYWAYKAMKMKIDNGEKLSLGEGLPIGRKVNGEIVDFKLDPSSRFLTFLAAGSGAGKGVLTLSMVAAAIGSGIPMFYMDFKPDMAPIFWDIEKKFNIPTFTYDGMVKRRPNSNAPNHVQGYGMPDAVRSHLEKFSGAILYLKAIQLMCAMAQYRADQGVEKDIMFVFDETQAMQRLIKAAVEKTVELKKNNAPKKGKGGDEGRSEEVYQYASLLLDWFKEVNTNIDTYVNTTGRKSNTFCLFIAQSPDYSTWTNLKAKTDDGQIELLSRITFADTIFKILGRGSTTSKYGLGGDGKKSVTPKELQYVANNRFFGMYDGKTTDGADIKIFKPFLTLNTDDPLDKCWTKGMGKKFGYGSVPNEQYFQNVAAEHPGEDGFTNSNGIHTGTGLLGLTSMYCGGDQGKVAQGFRNGWDYAMEFFAQTGLSAKYSNPSDYMYDTSINGLMMIGNMVAYDPSKENSVLLGIDSNDQDEELDIGDEVDTGWIVDEPIVAGAPNESSSIINEASPLNGAAGIPRYGETIRETRNEDDIERAAFEAYNNQAQGQEENTEWMGVDKGVTDSLLANMLDGAPDDADPLDLVSRLLQEDVLSGYTDPVEAEALARQLGLAEKGYTTGYDYTNGNVDIIDQEQEMQRQPINIDSTPSRSTEFFGKTGKKVQVDTSKTRNFTRLTDDNSIDCRQAGPGEITTLERVLLGTPRGASKYVNKIWKSVLSTIITQGYNPAMVTRVSLYGGQMYVNGKLIILDGVIGGRQNIRLKDIVEFRTLFKKLPMIRELRLDEEMIQASLTELGSDSIFKMFQIGTKLDEILIKMRDGSTQKCTRQSAQDERAQKILSQNQLENDIDTMCKSKSTNNWDNNTPGDNIWGMRLAKSSMSRAGEAFMDKNKPSIGRTIVYGTVGVVGGAIGFGLWGITRGIKGIFNLGKGFKR